MAIEDSRVLAAEIDAEALHPDNAGFEAPDDVADAHVVLAQAGDLPKTDRLPEADKTDGRYRAENGVVRLPAETSLDDLRVVGNDLVFVQADGSEIVILDGALKIPALLVGDVELSQQVLFAALEGSGINVAAGPDGSYSATGTPSSSGADFETIEQRQAEDIALAELLGDTPFADGDGFDDNGVDDGVPSILSPLGQPFIMDEAVIADGIPGNQIISGRLPFEQGPDFGTITRVSFVGANNVDEEGAGPQVLSSFTSGGSPITVTSFPAPSDGSILNFLALEGRDANGNIVFQLTIDNRITGDFRFQLVGKLDHPDAGQDDLDDLLRLGFTYTVIDLDGDFVTGAFYIDVMDDAPVSKGTVVSSTVLDDEAQGNGNNWPFDGVANVKVASGVAGSLFTAGADGVKLIEVSGSFEVLTTQNGFATPVTVTWGAGVTGSDGVTTFSAVGGAVTGAVLEIRADGSYKLTLNAPVVHAQPGTTEENATLSIDFKVTDGDGDAATGQLQVRVNDDTPDAKSLVIETTVLDDEAQTLFTPTNPGPILGGDAIWNYKTATGNAGALFAAGADGVKSVSVSGSFDVIYKDANGFAQTTTVSWGAGVPGANGVTTFTAISADGNVTGAVLTIGANGSYSLTMTAPVAHGVAFPGIEENETLSIRFTVTDGDNDTSSGLLKVLVNDDTPTPIASVELASTVLDDEAQGNGNNVPADGVANVSIAEGGAGSLFSAGADGVSKVSIFDAGFNVIHSQGGFAKVEGVEWSAGAQGPNGATTFTATGKDSGQTAAVLTINADGSYKFELKAPVAHSNNSTTEENKTLSLGFTVTDGDGDSAAGYLKIQVNDDAPVSKGTVVSSTVLDDEAQGSGNNWPFDGVANVKVASGVAGSLFTAGADGVKLIEVSGSFEVLTTQNGFATPVTVTWGAGVTGSDGVTTFSAVGGAVTGAVLEIRADGSYKLTLNAPVVHAQPGTTEENATLSIDFKVTDGDGDAATGQLQVRVNDDTPDAKSLVIETTVLDDEAQTLFTPTNPGPILGGDAIWNYKTATGNAGALFAAGADGVKSVSVSGSFDVIYKDANGFAQTTTVSWGAGVPGANGVTTFTAISADGNVTGAVLTIGANGSYSLTMTAPVAHGVAFPGIEENETLSIRFTVTDGDNDTSSGLLKVLVNDDTPTPIASVELASTVLDDEAQGNGNNVPADGVANVSIAEGGAGSLFSAGADGVSKVSIFDAGFNVIHSQGGFAKVEGVEWSAGAQGPNGATTFTATGKDSGQTAAVLTINADGSYKFELKAPVAHSNNSTTEENKTLSLGFTVTDGDGDSAAGYLKIQVNDDAPVSKGTVVSSTVLDDEAQGSGNNWPFDGVANVKVASGVAGSLFTAGADGVKLIEVSGSFEVLTTQNGFATPVTVTWGAGVTGSDGVTTFSAVGGAVTGAVLEIRADGSYKLTLNAPVVHAQPGTTEENATLSIDFKVTDGDGDAATGQLQVRVNDDTPDAKSLVIETTVLDDEAQTLFTPTNPGPILGGDAIWNYKTATGNAGALFAAGADGVKSVSVSGSFDVIYKDANGFAQTTTVSWGAGVPGANGVTTFTAISADGNVTGAVLTIGANGSYSLTMTAPVAHGVAFPGIEENETLSIRFTVTDGDNDTSSGLLKVLVNDDTPTPIASVELASTVLDDEAQGNGNNVPADGVANVSIAEGGAGSLFSAGADGVSKVSIFDAGFNVIHSQGGFAKVEGVEWSAGAKGPNGATTFTATGKDSGQTAAVLTINADGSYKFELKAPVAHSNNSTTEENKTLSLGFTVTDGDGDSAAGYLKIQVNDDTPTGGAGTTAWLNDDTLSGGIPGGEGDHGLANTNNVLNHSFGADGPGSIAWTGITVTQGGNPADFTSSVSNDGKTLQVLQSGTPVITAVLNPQTGQYVLTQNAPIKHALGGNENEIQFQFKYDVTDGDGDVAPGHIWVNVDDDTPKASDSTTVWLDDEDLAGGIPGGTGDQAGTPINRTGTLNHSFGADADGASISWLNTSSSNADHLGFTYTVADNGATLLVKQNGTLVYTATVNQHTGQYTITQNAAVKHPSGGNENEVNFQLRYQVKDGDGDTAEARLWVNVDDDTPTGGSGTTAWLDDDTLPGGNAGGVGDNGLANTSNVLKHSFGADGPGGIAWTGISVTSGGNQADFGTSVSQDGKTMQVFQSGTLVITAVLDPLTGQYTLTHNAPIKHAIGGNENEIQFKFNYNVTDRDGDVAPGYIWVNVDDDTPVINGTVQPANLLANGDFTDGVWANSESWGNWTTGAVGWKIEGTAPNQQDVRLERVTDGYLNMQSTGGAPMIDLGATPGNVSISQNISGLTAGETYQLRFELGSPSVGSAKLVVIWNGQEIELQPTDTMQWATLNLVASSGMNTLVFKEIGDPSDNTGTFLANVSLTKGVDIPVFEATTGEDDGAISFQLIPGVHYNYGADSNGTVAFDTGNVTIATPSGTIITLQPGDYSYDAQTGTFTINPGWAFNGLSEGEVAVLTVPFTVTDGDGDSRSAVYQVKIIGDNDVVRMSEGTPYEGPLTTITEYEETDPRAGSSEDRTEFDAPPGYGGLNGGTFHLYDDHGDTHQVLVTQPQGSSYLGYVTAEIAETTANDGHGVVRWHYHVTDAALNPLAEGDVKVETFTITVTDNHGTSTSHEVTITLKGTNDTPVITVEADDSTGAVIPETNAGLSTNGTLTLADVDLTDIVTASVESVTVSGPTGGLSNAQLASYLSFANTQVLDATETRDKLIWNFNSGSQAFDFLAEGETLTLTYVVRATDDSADAAFAEQTVTITINGTNDAPTVSASTPDHLVEAGHQVAGVASSTATLTLGDVDGTVAYDTHALTLGGWTDGNDGTWSKAGTYGVATLNLASNTVTYALDNGLANGLNTSDHPIETFDVPVKDNLGVTASTSVTFTIDGTNDEAEVTGTATGAVTEDGTLTIGDTLSVTDPDNAGFQTPTDTALAGDYGDFTFNASTGAWTYTLRNSAANVQDLNGGDVRNDTLIVHSADGSASQEIVVTINGVDDIPPAPTVNENTSASGRYAFSNNLSIYTPKTIDFVTASLFNDVAGPMQYHFQQVTNNWDAWLTLGSRVKGGPSTWEDGLYIYRVTATSSNGAAESTYVAFSALQWNAWDIVVTENSDADDSDYNDGNVHRLVANSGYITDRVETAGGDDVVIGDLGNNSVDAGSGDDAIYGMGGNDLLDGGSGTDFIDGGDGNDTIDGGNDSDVLLGGAGNDTIDGGRGNDILIGGSGADTLRGGNGDDLLIADQSDVLLDGGSGYDTLELSGDFTSANNGQIQGIERVVMTQAATLNLSNQTEDFKIVGSGGNDTITGGGGADIIIGGAGADTLRGNGGADQFRFATTGGTDTILDYTDGTDKIALLDRGNSANGSVNFSNTIGTAAGAALHSWDFIEAQSITAVGWAVDNKVIKITNALAEDQITSLRMGQNGSNHATNNYILVFNSTSGKGEIWFDNDWSDSNMSNRVKVAVLNNITTLAALDNINADDIRVYNDVSDPIVLDLDGNGFDFSSIDNGVMFDINADGSEDRIAWTSQDGILALDLDGNGLIDNGSEIFTPDFDGGNFESGIAALASLDSNGDGRIDAEDEAFSRLSIWVDANNNGVSDDGELSSLADNKVASISLTADTTGGAEDGQTIFSEGSFAFEDGTTGGYVEVGFEAIFGDGFVETAQVTGTDGDDILTGGFGAVTLAGGAGADSFVFDEKALDDLDVADIITDFRLGEGDVLDVTALLDTLLGEDATSEAAVSSIRAKVDGSDTTVSVQVSDDSWKDVAVLQNHAGAIKILFKDEQHDVQTS
nr:hypothetical protein RKHAN_00247 [Rhizobium sp. Khangiran2]